MDVPGKATVFWKDLARLGKPQIRAFHMSWMAFFLCFFAWFGIAPLMPIVREELSLTPGQVGATIIASVGVTVLGRLGVGYLCDRFGPRYTYSGLLVLGSLPVMGIALVQSFEAFLLFRLLIGLIGAAFVITQYHTSIMFAPNVVGTANATSAGWGNLGGGVAQMVMPLILAIFVTGLGFSETVGWRLAMIVAGFVCMLTGIAYLLLTQDAPRGNFKELRQRGELPHSRPARASFGLALRNHRVWALAVIYGACFGIELTINNIGALYFVDHFGMSITAAGFAAAAFGMMNLFARTLGGVFGDRFGTRWGLKGRAMWLFVALLGEGVALMCFSQMTFLPLAIGMLIVFSLFCQMAEGATFAVVPFVDRRALGPIAGIVGAGGNVGAVLAGFLFGGIIAWPTALLLLGAVVTGCAFLALLVRFSPEAEAQAHRELHDQVDPLPETPPTPVSATVTT